MPTHNYFVLERVSASGKAAIKKKKYTQLVVPFLIKLNKTNKILRQALEL